MALNSCDDLILSCAILVGAHSQKKGQSQLIVQKQNKFCTPIAPKQNKLGLKIGQSRFILINNAWRILYSHDTVVKSVQLKRD